MADKSLKYCSTPSCPNKTEHYYCTKCKPEPTPDTRPTSYERGYGGAAWLKFRKMVLRRHPVCTFCNKAPSTLVHHKIPKPEGENSFENCRGSCASCHNTYHHSKRNKEKNEQTK